MSQNKSVAFRRMTVQEIYIHECPVCQELRATAADFKVPPHAQSTRGFRLGKRERKNVRRGRIQTYCVCGLAKVNGRCPTCDALDREWSLFQKAEVLR